MYTNSDPTKIAEEHEEEASGKELQREIIRGDTTLTNTLLQFHSEIIKACRRLSSRLAVFWHRDVV